MKFPQVVRDLLAAREVLDARGLAKCCGYVTESGAVCALGALGWRLGGYRPSTEASLRLSEMVVSSYDDVFNRVSDWNDNPKRTKADVLQAFDDAASLALSEAVRP